MDIGCICLQNDDYNDLHWCQHVTADSNYSQSMSTLSCHQLNGLWYKYENLCISVIGVGVCWCVCVYVCVHAFLWRQIWNLYYYIKFIIVKCFTVNKNSHDKK